MKAYLALAAACASDELRRIVAWHERNAEYALAAAASIARRPRKETRATAEHAISLRRGIGSPMPMAMIEVLWRGLVMTMTTRPVAS